MTMTLTETLWHSILNLSAWFVAKPDMCHGQVLEVDFYEYRVYQNLLKPKWVTYTHLAWPEKATTPHTAISSALRLWSHAGLSGIINCRRNSRK